MTGPSASATQHILLNRTALGRPQPSAPADAFRRRCSSTSLGKITQLGDAATITVEYGPRSKPRQAPDAQAMSLEGGRAKSRGPNGGERRTEQGSGRLGEGRGGRIVHRSGYEPEILRVRLLGGFVLFVGSQPVGKGAWRLKRAAGLVEALGLMLVGALAALVVAAPVASAQSGNGTAPGDASGTIVVNPGDYPGSCEFPFSLDLNGKGKTSNCPTAGLSSPRRGSTNRRTRRRSTLPAPYTGDPWRTATSRR